MMRRNFLERTLTIRPNRTIPIALSMEERLISSAKKTIYIFSGNLQSNFYQEPRILKALRNTIEKRVRIEIISGPFIDKNSKDIIELIKRKKIDFWQSKKGFNKGYTIIDERDVELRHPEFTTIESKIVSDVILKDTHIAKRLLLNFNTRKKQATKTNRPRVK